MRRALLASAILLVPAAFIAGPATSQAANEARTVTFYGHVLTHTWAGPSPANTEFPYGEDNYGFGAGQEECVVDCRWRANNNVLILFSTAGLVDVQGPSDFAQRGGYGLLHNERGLTKDIQLDASKPMQAAIWISMDAHAWYVGNAEGTNCIYPHPPGVPCLYPYWGWDPGVFPDVVVEATFGYAVLGEHGADASTAPDIAGAIDGGTATILGQGAVGPATVVNGLPGYENVYEYVVDLGAPAADRIPREANFFVIFDPHMETVGNSYEPARGRIWGGEFFAPWFTLNVRNPIDVERVVPTWAHGKLAILGIMTTPWGSYDVRDATLAIQGPQGAVTPKALFEFAKSSVAHGGHYIPVNKTWVWDPNADGAREGPYTLTVNAVNWQASASASCTGRVTLVRGGDGLLTATNVVPGTCGQQSQATAGLEEQLRREAGG